MDPWVNEVIANPITKEPCRLDDFPVVDGFPDARVWLRNSAGFDEWLSGQDHFEQWEESGYGTIEAYRNEINYDRCVYEHFKMSGPILDVGGGVGTTREFLPEDVQFISADPFIGAPNHIPPLKSRAYSCLKRPLNFIGAMAEFLPFRGGTFQTVHMRSMLDHLQLPDLALLEARRVLQPDGRIIVGIAVEGPPYGNSRLDKSFSMKSGAKKALASLGVQRFRDHHTWHPTLEGLKALLTANGFTPGEPFWQPHWQGRVVYIEGKPQR